MNITIPFCPSGIITLSAKHKGHTTRQLTFPNVITNEGLNYIFSSPKYNGVGYYLGECQVGTDNTYPTKKDTQLGGFSASTNVDDGVDSTPGTRLDYEADGTPYWACNYRYTFPVGSIADVIREVGIAPYHTDSINLFSRALVRDQLYKPTEFVVLNDESLEVLYEMRIHLDPSDLVFYTTLNDKTRIKCTMRLAAIGQIAKLGQDMESGGAYLYISNGPIGTITGKPQGSLTSSGKVSFNTYTKDTYTVLARHTFSVGSGIWDEGIRALYTTTNFHSLQIEFDPPLPKKNTQKLRLQFKYNWGQYDP